jgi:hypothetical protein
MKLETNMLMFGDPQMSRESRIKRFQILYFALAYDISPKT